jgi:hypothetical protein
MRRIAVLSLALALTLGGVHLSTSAAVEGTTSVTATVPTPKPHGCPKSYVRSDFHRFIRRALKSPDRMSRFERRTLKRVIRCQKYPQSRPVLRRHQALYVGVHRERHYWRWRAEAIPDWLRGVLEQIAGCESGGDPRAIGGGGLYRGKYQFDVGTWASVGGAGDPAAASEYEQDVRAAALYRSRGAQPWPVCGVG